VNMEARELRDAVNKECHNYERIEIPDNTEVTIGDPGVCWTPLLIKDTKQIALVETEHLAEALR